MFRKLKNAFRPHGTGTPDRSPQSELDYHSACTVKLVRSTSMLMVGQRSQSSITSTLRRSKSSVSVESTTALYYYRRQEDRMWFYSQNQNCLEYLEELVALRREYTKSVNILKSNEMKTTISAKKNNAPTRPTTKEAHFRGQPSSTKPSAPPIPNEEDTLDFFDAVIASCEPERRHKSHVDDGHADVDFIVATSSSEHDLHSNWVMRVPRCPSDASKPKDPDTVGHRGNKTTQKNSGNGTTSSRRLLQRNPIHLPKVVESAFQTLRFKPKLKKKV
ncbi:hypothetical protein DPEC_G00051960 [Dallia pectoralis]|uniref:Uncharacterized protein n=1 Tax=Dallia pectoralis TaxID=75939 RepID=A0ACC2HBT6_DALPE|nr:hypothetical protein DPEC_G00051960 [Dallia pectoralis]